MKKHGLAVHLDASQLVLAGDLLPNALLSSGVAESLAAHSRSGGAALLHVRSGPAPEPDQTSAEALAWRSAALRDSAEAIISRGGHISFSGFLAAWSAEVGLWWEPLIICARTLDGDIAPGKAVSVRAIIPAFNEADILPHVVSDLIQQDVRVTVIDNWSTDGTFEKLAGAFGEAISLERFPATGATGTYEWRALLQRVEQVAAAATEDWIIFQDADEIRRSPWANESLPRGLARVEMAGFSAVNHTVLNFRPIDESWTGSISPESAFTWFSFPDRPSYFSEIKAWRNTGQRVDLTSTGGHEARFTGRRVYPWRFLMKHYPIRSQEHGQRKVLRDRIPRWSKSERSAGWHSQYDNFDMPSSFVWSRDELWRFDEPSFREYFLVETLTSMAFAGGNGILMSPDGL